MVALNNWVIILIQEISFWIDVGWNVAYLLQYELKVTKLFLVYQTLTKPLFKTSKKYIHVYS